MDNSVDWSEVLGDMRDDLPLEEKRSTLINALQADGTNLIYIDVVDRKKDLCQLAVRQNGLALEYVPEQLKTSGLCQLAVQQNGSALQFVPEQLKTQDLCQLAVQQNGSALQFVPEQLKTPGLCQLAVQRNSSAINYVPDKESLKIALNENGMLLENLHLSERCDHDLGKIAVKQNGMALQFVPEGCRSNILCGLAVKENGLALQFVPEEFKTLKLCVIAVAQKGNTALKYVPGKYHPIDLYELVVRRNPEAVLPDRVSLHRSGVGLNKVMPNEMRQEVISYLPPNKRGGSTKRKRRYRRTKNAPFNVK